MGAAWGNSISAAPSAVENVSTLKCNPDVTEYYTIQSLVQPYYANENGAPSQNATRVQSNLSLGCVGDSLSLNGKKFQEWRLDLCGVNIHQPCPDSAWGSCGSAYQCEDIWSEGSNTAFFYVETYPNPGNVYWDPSEEGKRSESSSQCFSKFAVLQQIQGALTQKFSPEKVVKQENMIKDGVLLSSLRQETAEDPAEVKIPGGTMSAHIQMDYATSSVCAPRASSLDKCSDEFSPVMAPRLPHANIVHILSSEAHCPNMASYTRSIARESASCDENMESLMETYFSSPSETIFNRIMNCLDAEDRAERIAKYASAFEVYFRLAHKNGQTELFRDALSLLITIPSKDAVKRACALVESLAHSESHDVVLGLAQMIAYSPVVESLGIPSELTALVSKFASAKSEMAQFNALLILASIARRTGQRSNLLSLNNIQSLPFVMRMDILRNAGDSISQHEFWRVLLSENAFRKVSRKTLEDTLINRSDKDELKSLIVNKVVDLPDFNWNVTVPEFSKVVGSKDLLGADYLHKAYAGIDYESCNTHEVRRFRYAANANTHLNLHYLDKSYQLWEVIVDESGSSDSTARTDYVRLVWKNEVYYNGPVFNLDCRTIHLDLFNRRFNYPTASASFQIGPVPVRISMSGSATIDVQLDGEICPLQGTVKALLDPSIYNSVSGSACAGVFIAKACIEVTGAFKTHLKPGFEASLTACPHLKVCPSADLTFTNNELKVEGVLQIKTSFKGKKEYKKTFGDWKFPDVIKPLIESGKCISI